MKNAIVIDNAIALQREWINILRMRNPGVKLARELQDLLNISASAAYDRLNCNSLFNLRELMILCQKYSLSFDSYIFSERTENTLSVEFPFIYCYKDLTTYLKKVTNKLGSLESIKKGLHLFYAARDLPLFYYFRYPELGAFKAWVWTFQPEEKNILYKKFDPETVPVSLIDAGSNLYEVYKKLAISELWVDTTLNNTIKQIKYYSEGGWVSIDCAEKLLKQLNGLVQNMENRLMSNEGPEFNLYHCPYLTMPNGGLLILGNKKIAFFSISSINTLITEKEKFGAIYESEFIRNVNNATLISKSSSAVRKKFFAEIYEKLENMHSFITRLRLKKL